MGKLNKKGRTGKTKKIRKLQKFKCFPRPKGVLSQQEIDVTEAITEALLCDPFVFLRGTKGTCIIDGQKRGEDAKCLIRFNLFDGLHNAYIYSKKIRTSDDVAEESINNVLTYRMELKESGIYQDDKSSTLILHTTHGRIVASICADLEPHERTAMLVAISEIFAHLYKEDTVLQDSAKRVLSLSKKENSLVDLIAKQVHKMFDKCELSAIKEWKEWRERAKGARVKVSLLFSKRSKQL
jgi:hypothetical protein